MGGKGAEAHMGVQTVGQNLQENGLVGERARAREWAEAHGLQHESVRAGHVRVLEEQQHVASQDGHAVHHGRGGGGGGGGGGGDEEPSSL